MKTKIPLTIPLVICVLSFHVTTMAAGWTPLAKSAPGAVNGLLLLSDGTVMAAGNDGVTTSNVWYRLTPDTNGSYINGGWTTLAPMHDTRLYCASQVLQDGRVFVAGGEYGSGGNTAEIYNPTNNTWAYTASGQAGYGDAESEMLPDGTVLVAPVGWGTWPQWATLIYNPFTNGWSFAGSSSTYQDEATWVKLPDQSILTVDPYNDARGTNSERYVPVPSLGAWTNDAHPPVPIFNAYGETGPAFLLPDGRVFFLGGTGHTLFYTPSGNTSHGTWAKGPEIPNGMAAQDCAGAMMANGKILCAVAAPMTSATGYAPVTSFYEYDPVANSFNTNVASPTGGSTDNIQCFGTMMLDLPDGTVLYSHFGADLYVYQPGGSPLPAGKPAITSISQNPDGSYHLVGTGLNGISEGADYGDDFQPHSNYPLVRFTSGSSMYYGRTFNWSSTGVMTGSTPVTTEFTVPTGLPPGACSVVVVANGIASDPVTFNGPVWVDFNYSGFQNGTFSFPYSTLAHGTNAVVSSGTIFINARVQPSDSTETMTISKPMTIVSVYGPSTIGH